MPTKELNVYWIDDESKKIDDFKSLIEDTAADYSMTVKIHKVLVDKNLLDEVTRWENSPPEPLPDLFMLDHILQVPLPHKMNGNTLAHLLRRTFSNIPLVSVTAMFAQGHDHSGQDINEYTAVYDYNELSENIEDMLAIARDYGVLADVTWDALIHLLRVPESEQNVLKLAIPQDLLIDSTPTKHNQIARWIHSELLSKPGFLYDELYAATLLGLTVTGFNKVSGKFDKALYQGPFATKKRPLWWQTGLRDLLYDILGDNSSDHTQAAGRMLAKFDESDLCKCYVSGVTDAIDFVIAQAYPNKLLHVVRDQFAIPHPDSYSQLPGFDQLLIIG